MGEGPVNRSTSVSLPDLSSSAGHDVMSAVLAMTNKRIDGLQLNLVTYCERRLSEVKATFEVELTKLCTSLTFTQAKLDAIKKTQANQTHCSQNGEMAERVSGMSSWIGKIEEDLCSLTLKIGYLENQSRRENIRTDGMKEALGEIWVDTEQVCGDIFSKLAHGRG